MRKVLLLAALPFVLTGCLGEKNAPDATLVADAPALVIPANFELRPPRTNDAGEAIVGDVSEESLEIRREAQGLILGGEAQKQMPTASTNDSWLLEQAGVETRNSSIRSIMKREQQAAVLKQKEEKSKGWFSRNFGGKKSDDVNAVDDVVVESSDIE